MQFMALDRYKITCVFVCVCVCPQNVSFTIMVKTPFGGQVARVNRPPFIPQKPLFGENLLLKLMDSVTAYILTTTKARNFKFCMQIDHRGH